MELGKTKTLKGLSCGHDVEVREITVDTLEEFVGVFLKIYGDDSQEFSFLDMIREFKEKLPLVCSIEQNQVGKLTMSQIIAIWEAFKEVNSDFLQILEGMGVKIQSAEILKKSQSIESDTSYPRNQTEQEESQTDKTERQEPSISPKEYMEKQASQVS